MYNLQYVLYCFNNIFSSRRFETFTSYITRDIIWTKRHTQIIVFVGEKEKYIYFEEYNVVVNKFDYRQLLDSIVLHIIAINTKISFNILIGFFRFFISFREEVVNSLHVMLKRQQKKNYIIVTN